MLPWPRTQSLSCWLDEARARICSTLVSLGGTVEGLGCSCPPDLGGGEVMFVASFEHIGGSCPVPASRHTSPGVDQTSAPATIAPA